MIKLKYKYWQILLSIVTFFVLSSSFYFQYVKGLQPCPLCLMQRFCVILLMLVTLSALGIHSLKLSKILTSLQIVLALSGLFFASRQLWLQSLPSQEVPACMPQLDILIRYFPWNDVLHALFWGAGDCAEISWKWLGLSMAGWSSLYFLFMLLTGIMLIVQLNKGKFHPDCALFV
ncbi:disulfide bond formation protein B [Legionella jordanis]|uniref:Disulfide bond formation protein B n=1 Tax=Legionella jordanis TaxID=456 RepID=A0A0W0VCH8_9GAMM|nr:disulfide bond formation protein B [Legionella jordanis]KTD17558.1 disulfide bond formation protein DsbB [Legionella jordanis]RMX05106.1 disulfide bond formation protein B [Legionella jordanis]RMX17362.1 disulfide bond formation protein B [Legionella jordanis]VEH13527.1 disulfide bond formation protein DsbB [Legionella jordanis]HAT8714443.1 disulfide bond formation protein B [Legionella jordanis]